MSPRRPRVLLDCDGVLADFVGGCRRALERLGYEEHAATLAPDRNIFEGLPEHVRKHLLDTIVGPRFCAELEPMPFALDAVRELVDLADVYVVTSPWWSSPHWVHERCGWIVRYFEIPHARQVHTSAKELVDGDHFVDDHDSQIARWRATHPRGLAHHWDRPNAGHWIALLDAVRAGR